MRLIALCVFFAAEARGGSDGSRGPLSLCDSLGFLAGPLDGATRVLKVQFLPESVGRNMTRTRDGRICTYQKSREAEGHVRVCHRDTTPRPVLTPASEALHEKRLGALAARRARRRHGRSDPNGPDVAVRRRLRRRLGATRGDGGAAGAVSARGVRSGPVSSMVPRGCRSETDGPMLGEACLAFFVHIAKTRVAKG